uniref:Uncharacterized protein n=1 Tax=Arundo donax TaxID=35708 RepID=A0A0A9B4Z7_ARUDO
MLLDLLLELKSCYILHVASCARTKGHWMKLSDSVKQSEDQIHIVGNRKL